MEGAKALKAENEAVKVILFGKPVEPVDPVE